MRTKLTIAIDGPSGSGKSTTARRSAERLDYTYVDTGAMYRAITLHILNNNVPIKDKSQVVKAAAEVQIQFTRTGDRLEVLLDGKNVTDAIREPRIDKSVGLVSENPGVRAILVNLQRSLAKDGGVVMEGRDIGTRVLPDADLKFFMDADLDIRAERRKSQLADQGVDVDKETVKQELVNRDTRDSERDESPLRAAEHAILIDTTNLSIEDQVDLIVQRAREKEAQEVTLHE
ncbi:MAG: (d)CMP kinase [Candidatus Marinimicrobia bacterium]|nr:(d)CMP kinase [Candidatus Neomarinimicrobiota bacterium]MCF7828571.1 (d)CMP kinase [Candidatus Neomarinimicrobiota bacterium]MCF7880312.1 (d)CMP kinase [Candidatus Neomarinimicrobiota bacterium]